MAWTFVQPGFFIQNLLMYAEAIREGAFYMPLGRCKVSWIDGPLRHCGGRHRVPDHAGT